MLQSPTVKADFPSLESIQAAASSLGCKLAALQAVAKVEASEEGAFLPSGEPLILFERHHFHRLTSGRYDGARASGMPTLYSLLSARTRTPAGGYGPRSKQHVKLQEAAKLDRSAALQSCSWGLYQIMGSNWRRCGFPSLQLFVNAMYRSAEDHLSAVIEFIRNDRKMHEALVALDFEAFADLYNGPAQVVYGRKLLAAYQTLSPAAL